MRLFVAACAFFAVALSIETRYNLYFGGEDRTANLRPRPKGSVLRRSEALNASCTNEPSSRHCWGKGFNIRTDVDEGWPDTGRTAYVRMGKQLTSFQIGFC